MSAKLALLIAKSLKEANTVKKAAKSTSILSNIFKSKSAQTAAKGGVIGGGVAAGGTLVGIGINQAVVKPLQDLGLVESVKTTGEKKESALGSTLETLKNIPKLTNTGKFVIIAGVAIIGILVIASVLGKRRR